MSRMALGAIWGYQRWLSPRKGYRCAYGALHGGTGCSGFAKAVIQREGLWRAVPLVRARFADCAAAAVTLQSRAARGDDGQEDERRADRRACCLDMACAVPDGMSCLRGCGDGAEKTDCTPGCGDASCGCDGCNIGCGPCN